MYYQAQERIQQEKKRKYSTEVRLLWPAFQFGTRAEENNRRSNLTAHIPLVAETKMGFCIILKEQVFQSQMFGAQESAAREPAELSLQKGCLISRVPAGLGCYLKHTERRCAGGHRVEEAGQSCSSVLHSCSKGNKIQEKYLAYNGDNIWQAYVIKCVISL